MSIPSALVKLRWRYPFALLSALVAASLTSAGPVPPTAAGRDRACAATWTTVTESDQIRVLDWDPRGRGLVVLALGDPATARHVAVLVPGSDTDLRTLHDPARPDHRPLGWARALHDAAGPGTAVVLWVGYPTPQGLGIAAASGGLARAGSAALTAFVDHLNATRSGAPPHLTVIGHSYGAVVTAMAAPRLSVDDLVLLGSPGARARTIRELHTSARVWAARTEGDWTRLIPHIQIGDLGHGTDPTSPAFGARLLPVGGTSGHDGYFRPGSAALAGLAGVANGTIPGALP